MMRVDHRGGWQHDLEIVQQCDESLVLIVNNLCVQQNSGYVRGLSGE